MENIVSPGLGYFILALNGVLLIVISLFAKRLNRNTQDFFAAGHKVKWPLLSMSVVVVFAYASTILLAAEGAYIYGWPAIWLYITSGLSLIIMIPFFKRIKKILPTGTTLPEFLYKKLGKKVHIMSTMISIYLMLIVLLYMLTGLGSGLSPLFGISYEMAVIFAGALIILYTIIGGLWGSLFTDYVQYFILWITISVSILFVVWAIGGFGEIYDGLVANDAVKGYSVFTYEAFIDYGLFMLFGYLALALVDQTILQRVYAIEDEKKLPKMLTIGYVAWAFMPMVAGLFGIIALQQGIVLEGAATSEVLPTVINQLAPFWVIVLFSLLIFNAIASTTNSILVGISNLIMNDVYLRYFKRNNHTNPGKQLLFARVLVVLGGIVGIAISTTPNSILSIGQYMVNFVIVGASPIIIAFLIKKVNPNSVFISMLTGFILALFISGKDSIFGISVYTWQINIFLYVLGMLIVLIGTKMSPVENRNSMISVERDDQADHIQKAEGM